MKKLILIMIILAFMSAPALAAPTLGWWDDTHPRSITATWDFTQAEPGADGSLFEYGQAAVTNGTGGDAFIGTPDRTIWDDAIVDPCFINVQIKLENFPEALAYKEIWVDVVFEGSLTGVWADGDPIGSYDVVQLALPNPGAPNMEADFGFRISPNPWKEKIQFTIMAPATGGLAKLYSIRIDTICVSAPSTISLLTPNGGEILTAGDTYPVTWSSTGSISDVLIEYSTNNGGAWASVNPPNTGNTGLYNWLVPQVNSAQCLVRISDSSNPSVNDISDGVFTIETQSGPTYSFDRITNNSTVDTAGQYTVELNTTALGVSFTFTNAGPYGVINEIYFDDGTLLGEPVILNGPGVSFVHNPVSTVHSGNLPRGNALSPPFVATAIFSTEIENIQADGVGSGEWLTLDFDLLGTLVLADVIAALELERDVTGSLSIGIHVHGLPDEFSSDNESDAFVNVISASSPSLISIAPDNAQQGDTLPVTITGQNTNFTQGSGTTRVWFSQGSSTIDATSFPPSSDTSINANFDIPGGASTGLWNVNVEDDIDGTLTLTDGFTINVIPNLPPVADAGPGQTVTDTDDNGSEQVTLDGSGSYDPDGTIVSWVWTDDLGDPIPDGEVVIATLSVGIHNITLTVTDNMGATDTDTVVKTVRARPAVTWYVDDDAPNDPVPNDPSGSDPLEDGTVAHPFDAIQEGIDAAFDGDTVMVLDGTYTGVGNRDIDFNGLAITVQSQNGPDTCIIDCEGTSSEPHRGFSFHNGEGPDSVLTGFTITNGYAPNAYWSYTGDSSYRLGGGVHCYSSPTLTNCTFTGNVAELHGGGMFSDGSNPILINCKFVGNSAANGGGIFNFDSNSTITNCTFIDNSAATGGGIYVYPGSPTITNCTFIGNSASSSFFGGSAIGSFEGSYITITNCTFWGNTGRRTIDSVETNITMTNCIIWGNISGGHEIVLESYSTINVDYCDVQGGQAAINVDDLVTLNWGAHNIDADPNFVDSNGADDIPGTEDDNLRLLPDSSCIDAGDPCYIPDPCETDLDGNPRVIGGRIDMGAYESAYKSDLLVTSEDLKFMPLPGVPGETVTISADIYNTGEISAEDIIVSFKDSTGPIGSDQMISSLDPNQFATVSIQHSWPDASYQLITVTADPANDIEELDETNNTGSKVYQVGYPADANAILEVLWNSAPACYTEGTSTVIQGKAEYKIEITGADDIVSAALGSIVTAQLIDSNEVVTNLQSTFTGPGGYFYIPFIVPGVEYGPFRIKISITDGTLTGAWEKLFCILPPGPRKDLWICDLTVSNDTPDIDDVVTVCATVCAAPDNAETVLNIPVTFYAYPPAGGAYQIGQTQYIDQMARGDSNSVCVDWIPAVNGRHRIRAGIGISDDNNGNNYRNYYVTVGMFNITASPKWAEIGDTVTITVDAREQLPSGQLDSITVLDNAGQPIPPFPLYPGNPSQPSPTRWVYQTDPLPVGTAFDTATITVKGTDAGSVQHTGQGYFKVYEIRPDFWVHSCDINFSNLNPDLGEPITIDAVVHADSSNPEEPISDIPVSFYSKHLPSDGEYIKIYQTQYTDEISPGGVSTPVYVPWQNAAQGEYIIKAQLGPGHSDRNNGNNAATRAILVGDNIPFDVEFEVVNKTRIGRWIFDYECNVRMNNLTGLTLENVQLELIGVSGNMTIVNPPYVANIADIGPNGSKLSGNTCVLRVDRSEEINSAQISWNLIYQIVDICGILQQESTSTILFDPVVLGDITGEGVVGAADLIIMGQDWLQADSIADIAPQPDGDGIVNLQDFAVLAEHWLESIP